MSEGGDLYFGQQQPEGIMYNEEAGYDHPVKEKG